MKKETRNRIILFAAIIAVLILSAIAIFSQPKYAGSESYGFFEYEDLADSTQYLNVTVNDFTIAMDTYVDGTIYDTAWLTTEYDTTITVGDFSGYRVYINSQEVAPGGTVSFRLDRLSKDSYIDVQTYSESGLPRRTMKIRTLNSSFPDMTTYNASNDNTDICYSIPDCNYIAKSDHSGNVIFYRLGTGISCFRQYNVGGKIRYSFMEQTGTVFPDSSDDKCYQAVVMDEKYSVIDIITSTISEDGSYSNGLCYDGFSYIDDFNYITASRYAAYKESTSEGSYRAAFTRVQNLLNGSAAWTKDYCSVSELNPAELVLESGDQADDADTAEAAMDLDSDNTGSQYAFPDHLGLSEIRSVQGSDHTFLLFKNAGVISIISRADGELVGSVCVPDEITLRDFDIVSDNEVLCMFSDRNARSYAAHLSFGSVPAFNNVIDLCQYSSGDGCIDASGTGNFIVAWDNNSAKRIKFTEYSNDGKKVLLEVRSPENTDLTIDCVSYAEREAGAV